jgi:hypothetical protein
MPVTPVGWRPVAPTSTHTRRFKLAASPCPSNSPPFASLLHARSSYSSASATAHHRRRCPFQPPHRTSEVFIFAIASFPLCAPIAHFGTSW